MENCGNHETGVKAGETGDCVLSGKDELQTLLTVSKLPLSSFSLSIQLENVTEIRNLGCSMYF